MSKVVLANCILCLCLMNVNLVTTVHAEDLSIAKLPPDTQSKNTKSVIIDGVEYISKSSIKGRKKTKTKSANTVTIGGVEYVPIDNNTQKKNDSEHKSEPKRTVSDPIQSSLPINKSPEPVKEDKAEPKPAFLTTLNSNNMDNISKPAEQNTSTSIQARPKKGSAIDGDLQHFVMKGKIGAGIEASVVNLGIGPSVEYWITENIVASGHLGFGTFTSYGIRGDYVFNKPLVLGGEPYAGLGYTSIKGPEVSGPGYNVKSEGSGVDVHFGLFMPSQYIYKNIAMRTEIAYSTANVGATASVNGLPPIKVTGSYSSFGLGVGIYYYFN